MKFLNKLTNDIDFLSIYNSVKTSTSTDSSHSSSTSLVFKPIVSNPIPQQSCCSHDAHYKASNQMFTNEQVQEQVQLLDLDNKIKPRYKKFKNDLISSHLKSSASAFSTYSDDGISNCITNSTFEDNQ